jgi:hypothetical protein
MGERLYLPIWLFAQVLFLVVMKMHLAKIVVAVVAVPAR